MKPMAIHDASGLVEFPCDGNSYCGVSGCPICGQPADPDRGFAPIFPWAMVSSAVLSTGYAVVKCDAVELMSSMPNDCVDLYATDPAYESLEKHRAVGTTTRLTHSKMSSNDWFPIFKNERFPELLAQMYRTLRRNRHAYIMCDDETSDVIKPMATAAGFKVWSRLVWDKMTIGMGYHWRSQSEFILFLEKGKRRLNNLGWSNIIQQKRVRNKDAYPTEKPPELFERVLLNSTQPGELVMDPFCGSGACGKASIANGRKWVGVDVVDGAIQRSRALCGGIII